MMTTSPINPRLTLYSRPTMKDLALMESFLQDLLLAKRYPIKMQLKLMKGQKKEDYYGTCVRKYLYDGASTYEEEGTIYINLKACRTVRRLCKVLAHEVEHLLDDIPIKVEVQEFLEARLLAVPRSPTSPPSLPS
jgi:hypothetical protein